MGRLKLNILSPLKDNAVEGMAVLPEAGPVAEALVARQELLKEEREREAAEAKEAKEKAEAEAKAKKEAEGAQELSEEAKQVMELTQCSPEVAAYVLGKTNNDPNAAMNIIMDKGQDTIQAEMVAAESSKAGGEEEEDLSLGGHSEPDEEKRLARSSCATLAKLLVQALALKSSDMGQGPPKPGDMMALVPLCPLISAAEADLRGALLAARKESREKADALAAEAEQAEEALSAANGPGDDILISGERLKIRCADWTPSFGDVFQVGDSRRVVASVPLNAATGNIENA